MSRTTRRNKAWLIADRVGTLEAALKGEWFAYCWRFTEKASTIEKAYQLSLAKFTRDRCRGTFSPPHWYSRHFTRDDRRVVQRELRRCFKQNDWDDHLSPLRSNRRTARSEWFW